MSGATIVYRKTSAGLAEMQDRRLDLPRKTRSLLLAIDGRRSREQLCSSLSAYGDVGRQLDDLEILGLIESFDPDAARRGPDTRPGVAGPRTRIGPDTVSGPRTSTDPRTVPGPQTLSGPRTLSSPHTLAGPKTLSGPKTVAGQTTLPGPRTLAGPLTIPGIRTGADSPVSDHPATVPVSRTPATDEPSTSAAGGGGPTALPQGRPAPPDAVSLRDSGGGNNLIDIRAYLGPASARVDDALLPREAMVSFLSRSVDLENYELLHAIEATETREQLLELLPAYLVDIARRFPPATCSDHVEALAQLTGMSVAELIARVPRRSPAR
jgi:hypothetical protein